MDIVCENKYFKKDGLSLAKSLVGDLLVRKIDNIIIKSKIVETEAYIGPEDKGCHAYNNNKTKRTEPMFYEGGYIYVYLIYGMYHCLNIVAGKKNKPEAVLIRSVEPLNGYDYLSKNRKKKIKNRAELTNGPSKLCQALKIDKNLNRKKLSKSNGLYIAKKNKEYNIECSKRINIDYAEEYKDKKWRFFIKDNQFISK